MKFIKRFWLLILLLIILLAWQPIWQNYQLAANASTPAGMLASDMGFTNKAKLLFYATSPKAEDKATFQKSCPSSTETPELGCYYLGKIFYMTIDRPEFKTEEDVTAAHEMLHAAYANLSDAERTNVNAMVEAEAKMLNNAELNATMVIYARTEPGQRDNELHSILGTEYASLSPDLESYYSQYFTDRTVVTNAHKVFHDAVTEKSSVLSSELANLNAQKAQLQAFKSRMDYLESTNQISAFNAQVDNFNASVKAYNQAVANYNLDATETNAIFRDIDSTQLPGYDPVQSK